MRLTVQAKALESGAKGDVIKVENLQSKQLVESHRYRPEQGHSRQPTPIGHALERAEENAVSDKK